MKLQKNNGGFTLIELIVVMLIMAILTVGSIAGLNLMNVGSAKNTAKEIMAKLSYVQVENMTRNETYYMKITKGSSDGEFNLYILFGSDQQETKKVIKLKDAEIKYEYDNFEEHTISTADSLVISFRKDTGGVKEDSGRTIIKIKIKAAGETSIIRLVPATGKHFIE